MSDRVEQLVDELLAEIAKEQVTDTTSIPIKLDENGDIYVEGVEMEPAIDDPDLLKPYERVYFPEFKMHGVQASYRYRYIKTKDRGAQAFRDGYAFATPEAAAKAGQVMAAIFAKIKSLP